MSPAASRLTKAARCPRLPDLRMTSCKGPSWAARGIDTSPTPAPGPCRSGYDTLMTAPSDRTVNHVCFGRLAAGRAWEPGSLSLAGPRGVLRPSARMHAGRRLRLAAAGSHVVELGGERHDKLRRSERLRQDRAAWHAFRGPFMCAASAHIDHGDAQIRASRRTSDVPTRRFTSEVDVGHDPHEFAGRALQEIDGGIATLGVGDLETASSSAP